MAAKNEKLIRWCHEKCMKEFMKEISDLISNIPEHIVANRSDVRGSDSGWPHATEGVSAPWPEEHSGPDKVNELRNEVSSTQPSGILNPDKQCELMKIIKQKSEEFERELRRKVSVDENTIASAAQKFKDELMDNTHKQLIAIKYYFTN